MGFCPSCGAKIENGNDQFCMNCGYNFSNQNYNMNGSINNQFQGYTPQSNNYTNGWGIAGFVCSLISLLCCGILLFAGLPMSIVGLIESKKHNGIGRGLSIAGIVISGVAVLVLIFNILFVFMV